MIDPTKIRVGDEVTVRTKAFAMFSDDSLTLSNGFIRVYDYITVENILSHTPAPRPFVIGKSAQHRSNPSYRAIVRGEFKGWLWLEKDDELFSRSCNDYEPCE